mmetsp:Transcript_13214/g.20756  ORF Transcript_13214/g.20756 Transcript_13214/m.20756 type:complete len:89 (+) Transcript_13214:668-934(+)
MVLQLKASGLWNVASLIPGSLAAASGQIRAGDILIAVNGQKLHGLSPRKAAFFLESVRYRIVYLILERKGQIVDLELEELEEAELSEI